MNASALSEVENSSVAMGVKKPSVALSAKESEVMPFENFNCLILVENLIDLIVDALIKVENSSVEMWVEKDGVLMEFKNVYCFIFVWKKGKSQRRGAEGEKRELNEEWQQKTKMNGRGLKWEESKRADNGEEYVLQRFLFEFAMPVRVIKESKWEAFSLEFGRRFHLKQSLNRLANR